MNQWLDHFFFPNSDSEASFSTSTSAVSSSASSSSSSTFFFLSLSDMVKKISLCRTRPFSQRELQKQQTKNKNGFFGLSLGVAPEFQIRNVNKKHVSAITSMNNKSFPTRFVPSRGEKPQSSHFIALCKRPTFRPLLCPTTNETNPHTVPPTVAPKSFGLVIAKPFEFSSVPPTYGFAPFLGTMFHSRKK